MKPFKIKRMACPICISKKKEHLYTIKNMPIYFGCREVSAETITSDQTFIICKNCSCIYVEELIDLELLYGHNHNTDIVGKTWKKHYELFYEFIFTESFANKKLHILEIGDASAKLARLSITDDKINSWTIVEPSQNINKDVPNKISYINDWYKDKYVKNQNHDLVVMSHVFEHLSNPKTIFDSLSVFMNDDAKIYLSVPNLQDILYNKKMSPAGLHFEHTFYYDIELLKLFFETTGWAVDKHINYQNHSHFLKLIKTQKVNNNYSYFDTNKKYFIESIEDICSKVKEINKEISNYVGKVYLYGAHIQTQIMLNLGLEQQRIESILDNSKQKHKKVLYGTNLRVEDPKSVLSLSEECMIVCHMGHYTEEIIKEILSLNSKVRFV